MVWLCSQTAICGFGAVISRSASNVRVHVKLPICFCSNGFAKYVTLYSDILWFAATDDFNKDEWFVDLDKMREAVPEVSWNACGDAVNPDSFSLDGFRFATH